jgi:hypothetical protein
MRTHYDHQVGRFEAPKRLDDREALIARARQARAEATAELFGALFRRLASVARAAVGSVRGAALMPPRGDLHVRTRLHLTGGCD